MSIVCISTRRSFPLMVALLQRGIICEDEVHVPTDLNDERTDQARRKAANDAEGCTGEATVFTEHSTRAVSTMFETLCLSCQG